MDASGEHLPRLRLILVVRNYSWNRGQEKLTIGLAYWIIDLYGEKINFSIRQKKNFKIYPKLPTTKFQKKIL